MKKKELDSLRKNIIAYRTKDKEEKKGVEYHSDSESSGGEDISNEVEIKKKKNQNKAGRKGVSAEAYGMYNHKKKFVAKVIPKSNEQISRIKNRIINSFIFNNLDQNDIKIVINAMEERIFASNEFVINQGDTGDCLYVVEHGDLECFKKFKKEEAAKLVKTYVAGDSFGELALLYNAPRAATIKTKTQSILWSLDRETFNNIVKQASIVKHQKYESFLKSVELLSTVEPYELSQVCDSIKVCSFKKNEFVIKEGEAGDIFYIIEEGTASAFKQLKKGEPVVKILDYKRGQYFGELALLDGGPRKASIMATSDLKLLSLDRISFKRLLGPLETLLKRNSEKYTKFMQK